jgi:hypothetical protein
MTSQFAKYLGPNLDKVQEPQSDPRRRDGAWKRKIPGSMKNMRKVHKWPGVEVPASNSLVKMNSISKYMSPSSTQPPKFLPTQLHARAVLHPESNTKA